MVMIMTIKSKGVPVHAMVALGGRGDIAALDLGTRWG
jgi:hypothetical protein